jgi:hypothetical protein
MPHAGMTCVFRSHYTTEHNPESSLYEWPDTIVHGVELDDVIQLQMFEVSVSSNSEIGAYECHIASKKERPTHDKDKLNRVYKSWRFHNYFDGLKVKPANTPPILIRPEKSYVAANVEVNGHTYKRQDRRAYGFYDPKRMR